MEQRWAPDAPGVLALPSGRLVRGRALRRPLPDGPVPEFGLYLRGRDPGPMPWPYRWVRWPDFLGPGDAATARRAIIEVWKRSADERVEIACGGGKGRTGTALACVVALDSASGVDAVAYVRMHYDRRAVEIPWQRRFVNRFAAE